MVDSCRFGEGLLVDYVVDEIVLKEVQKCGVSTVVDSA